MPLAVKDIEGFTNYSIDYLGGVYNKKSKKFLKPFTEKMKDGTDGYIRFELFEKGKRHSKRLHRLLCETFIPNPEDHPTVDHIDQDKTNNSIDNLRWASHSMQQINQATSEQTGRPTHVYSYKLANGITAWYVLITKDKVRYMGKTFYSNESNIFDVLKDRRRMYNILNIN